jgi:cation diffusion facilitator CzcD-associated flavoprotein CzcO
MQFPSNGANGSSTRNGSGRSIPSTETTVVIGAGPGGLCPAYVLSRAGVPAITVEHAPFLGGLARTIKRQTPHDEFAFDVGGLRGERYDLNRINAKREYHEIKRVTEPVGAVGATRQ